MQDETAPAEEATANDPAASDDRELKVAIRCEQVNILYDAVPLSALANVLIALMLTGGLWDIIDHALLATWATVVSIVSILRMALYLGFKQAAPAADRLNIWIRLFYIGAIAAGLVLGAVILMVPGKESLAIVLSTFTVVSVIFGAALSLSFLPNLFPIYLSCAVTPVIFKLLTDGNEISNTLLMMTATAVIFALRSSIYTYRNSLHNISLRLEAVGREADLRRSKVMLADERTLLRSVIDAIPDMIHFKGADGAFLGCNRALASNFKLDETAIVGHFEHEFFDARIAEKSQDLDDLVRRTLMPQSVEDWLDYPDGRRAQLEMHKLPFVLSHGGVGTIGIAHDITERKQTEKELTDAKRLAEESSHSKSTFLANMSHEIRTPMNAILGLTYQLRQKIDHPDQRDKLEKIHRSAWHLLGIINDILDLSKIEADRLTLEETSINADAIVDQAISIIAERAREKHLALHTEIDPALAGLSLLGDPLRMRQVLINFLGNAVKFTEQGSITVRVALLEADAASATLRFEVIDSGIGIPEESLGKIFDAFEQAETSTTRRFGGTGLGLTISRKLARLMGGETGVSSTPNVGSTFWFQASLKRGESVQPVLPTLDTLPDYRGRRVLLVEDNLINQEVANAVLEEIGLTVRVANHGVEALALVSTERFDLILMDMQMPVMDGIEATRQIRALSTSVARTPIIAMTANAFDEDRQRCKDAGMNDFIAKPVDPDYLFRVLARWLTDEATPEESVAKAGPTAPERLIALERA